MDPPVKVGSAVATICSITTGDTSITLLQVTLEPAHTPLVQVSPDGHLFMQPPQFSGSLWTSVQALEHMIVGGKQAPEEPQTPF
jgi:hypothetical protein